MKKSHNSHIISCFSIFALLTTLTTVSALILSSSSSHAETSSVLASVTVPDVCTLSADSSSTAHTATVEVGTYTQGIGETLLNVLCNDNNGYSIYAVGYSNNTEGNTNLIGTTGNIPTGTANDGSVSNWAMKLTPVTGTFPATILNGYDNYHTVPNTAEKVATRTSSIDLSANSQVKTTYAVSISPSQAKDTYTGKVKYTVVHPNYAKSDGSIPPSLYDTIAAMSKGSFDMSTLNDALSTENSGVFKYTGEHSDGANVKDIYFYRGIIDSTFANTSNMYGASGDGALYPNYVKLTTTANGVTTNTCWRIIRTTGTGGVKMLYNGIWGNNTCAQSSPSTAQVKETYYNRGTNTQGDDYYGTLGFITYAGYNYNPNYAYNEIGKTTAVSNADLFNNQATSNIRTEIENWYTSKIAAANNNIFEFDAGYCNDRTTYESYPQYTNTSITIPYNSNSGDLVSFGARIRDILLSNTAAPTLACENTSGKDLLNGTTGKSYPIALITADEAVLAGNGYCGDIMNQGTAACSKSSFLTSGTDYYTLSAGNRNGYTSVRWVSVLTVDKNGSLSSSNVHFYRGVRPVISLAPGAIITGGSGTATNPWIVQ